MDGPTIQTKVDRGYAIAGLKAGFPHTQYRAAGAVNPLAASNAVGRVSMTLSTTRGKPFSQAASPKDITEWLGHCDTSGVRPGDYLDGAFGTFLVGQQAPFVPVQLFLCNRVISVLTGQAQAGQTSPFTGYGGETKANDVSLMRGFPAALAQGGRGDKSAAELPTDVYQTGWVVHVAAVAGVVIHTDDILTDDLGNRYSVSAANQMGGAAGLWRIIAMLNRA